jgi:hypothetical protein
MGSAPGINTPLLEKTLANSDSMDRISLSRFYGVAREAAMGRENPRFSIFPVCLYPNIS